MRVAIGPLFGLPEVVGADLLEIGFCCSAPCGLLTSPSWKRADCFGVTLPAVCLCRNQRGFSRSMASSISRIEDDCEVRPCDADGKMAATLLNLLEIHSPPHRPDRRELRRRIGRKRRTHRRARAGWISSRTSWGAGRPCRAAFSQCRSMPVVLTERRSFANLLADGGCRPVSRRRRTLTPAASSLVMSILSWVVFPAPVRAVKYNKLTREG